MRIIALLSWYEEDPAWLAECVASAARLCDHLIAVDGPYVTFPGSTTKPASGSEQADVIARTAAGAGMGCTIHSPRNPWWGGEVEKRDFMFQLGQTFAEPAADWYLRIDADEVLTQVPADTRRHLEDTDLDVAEVTLWDRGGNAPAAEVVDAPADSHTPFRCLFRALPGIRIEQAHYIVTAVSGGQRKVLRGNDTVHVSEPAEPLPDVKLEHRTAQRTAARWRLKREYYTQVPDIEHVEPFR